MNLETPPCPAPLVVRRILDSNPPSVFTRPAMSPVTPTVQQLARQLAQTPLMNRFSYIYDYRVRQLLFVSQGIERLLGSAPAPGQPTVEWLYARVHPDDAAAVAQASVLVNTYIRQCPADEDFSHFVMTIDYRLRHAAGHYLRVLRQNLILERDRTGAVITTAAIYTDISHHKRTPEVRLHVNRPDFACFARRHAPAAVTAPSALSPREQQVATLVLEGLRSEQIARQLGLSKATVSTHRRNLRRKLAAPGHYTLLCCLD